MYHILRGADYRLRGDSFTTLKPDLGNASVGKIGFFYVLWHPKNFFILKETKLCF